MTTLETLPEEETGESTMHSTAPAEEPVIQIDPIDYEFEREDEHVSPEDVVSEAAALEQRHEAEKGALANKKQLAIVQLIGKRKQIRTQFGQADAEIEAQLERLGYHQPSNALTDWARAAEPVKRRGRPPGSGKKASAAPAAAHPKTNRGSKKGAKRSPETIAKMKAAWAKRKKEAAKAK